MTSPSKNRRDKASRLVLGTAQLGMPYGIANRKGQPDFESTIEIVKTAWECGIREFDTAQAYGESEIVLGKAISFLGLSEEAKITTKLDPSLNPLEARSIKASLEQSLERLQVRSLCALVLHREEWMDAVDGRLADTLQSVVAGGLVRHLGVSLYSPGRAMQALESGLFTMIQIPANILDRRFADAGIFRYAEEKRKKVYVRSVFLQGLLLMKPEDLTVDMAIAKPALAVFERLGREYNMSRRQMALLYVKQACPDASVIFGAEAAEQVEQNVRDWEGELPEALMNEIRQAFPGIDENLLDPSRWPRS